MRIVEDFETEDEIMINRLKLRKYLRELVVNQKRVLAVALDQNYVQKVKEYFDMKKLDEEESRRKMEEKLAKGEEADEDEYYDEEEEDENEQIQ